MARRIQDLVAERAVQGLVGREAELATLLRLLEEATPIVLHVHGIGGIGKSSLLTAFAEQARSRGSAVAFLDCRAIEPTERAFLYELGAAIGGDISTIETAAKRLDELGTSVVVLLDTYEVFRSMDTWLRQKFIPALPENVRIVFSGREPPVASWLISPGWQGLFQTLRLGPLDGQVAIRLLQRAGIGEADARRIDRVSRGHPLALQLAASVADQGHDADLEGAAISRVVEELARIYFADIDDLVARKALEAGSVVRSVTVSLLAEMLPATAPQDAFERLRTLPFVEQGRDGLHVHDVVQQAIAASLRSTDPERHRNYRRAAWRQLQREVRAAAPRDLWRYTADMLYILENPIVREAFFPSGGHVFAVEPVRTEDLPAIQRISARHENPTATRFLEIHCQREPQTVWGVRDPHGSVVGFFTPFVADSVSQAWLRSDPIMRQWLTHLERDPVPRSQRVMFVPRSLSDEFGETPSVVQAATWLETKRMYMELRPRLRRVYFSQRDLETPWPALEQLGFRRIPEADVEIGDAIYRTAMLDFGPASVDGWLAGVVAAELGVDEDDLLDIDARELLIDGKRVGLTRLEFAVMRYLYQHEGKAISRMTLLENVWGHSYEGGSNVVDAVVRTLRKKLGEHASSVETVRGTGYRFRRS